MTDSESIQIQPYKVSTITAIGSIQTDIDLSLLFEHAPIVALDDEPPLTTDDTPAIGIVYLEFGSNKTNIVSRGLFPKKRKAVAPTTEESGSGTTGPAAAHSKRFENQATVIIKMSPTYKINMKVFRNGKIQMTGIKNIDDGIRAIEGLIQIVRGMEEKGVHLVKTPETMAVANYEICLINSDFRVNFEIRRELLYTVLTREYHNKCTYEPCIYPGVKLQYFWNPNNALRDGRCYCTQHCGDTRGDARGRSGRKPCKKITIVAFQSGCIIITGASMISQVDECYAYINALLVRHIDTIKKQKFVPAPTPQATASISL